jgi:DNA-binding FadR family transcriptional regulator
MTVLAPDVGATVQRFRSLLQRGEASFRQLMELRQMTEGEMAALAATNRSADDLQQMQAMIVMQSAHADDYAACLEADLAFHLAVAHATGNPFVMAFFLPINSTLRDSYRRPISYLATQPHTIAEHRAIADAIAERDVDAARLATTRHLDRILVDAARLIGDGMDAADL